MLCLDGEGRDRVLMFDLAGIVHQDLKRESLMDRICLVAFCEEVMNRFNGEETREPR